MSNLQSSGAISLGDIKNLFGGNYAMSSYYRGGSYIPATKTVSTTTYEPTSGDYYNRGAYGLSIDTGFVNENSSSLIGWFGTIINNAWVTATTSYTSGGYTYYRGSFRGTYSYTDEVGSSHTWYLYGVYRSSTSTSTVSINTGIPSSGQLSISQFYSAEKP